MNSILFSLALLFAGVSLTLACNSASIREDCMSKMVLANTTTDPCPPINVYWNCLKARLVGCNIDIETYRAGVSSYVATYRCTLYSDSGSSHVTVSAITMIISLLLGAWKGLN